MKQVTTTQQQAAKERRDVKRRIRQLTGDTLEEVLQCELTIEALRCLRAVVERSNNDNRAEVGRPRQ